MPTAIVAINIMIINLVRNLCVHEYDIVNGSAAVVLPHVVVTVHVCYTLGVHSVNASACRMRRQQYNTSISFTLKNVCCCLCGSCFRVCRIVNDRKDHCQIPEPFYNLSCMCGLN